MVVRHSAQPNERNKMLNRLTAVVLGVCFLPLIVNAQSNSVRAYHSASQSIANSTETALSLDSEYYDYGNLHDTTTNNSRLTAQVAGVYHITGSLQYAVNGTGIRVAYIRLNGTTDIAAQTSPSSSASSIGVTVDTIYYLNANDYVELTAYQTSGGNLNVNSSGNYTPEFSMQLVGGQANGARVYSSSAQSISNSSETAINLDSERYDYGSFHDTVTNNTRLTAPVAGIYHISGSLQYAVNGTGVRVVYIRLNGTTDIAAQTAPSSSASSIGMSLDTLYYLNAGDYVELTAYQTSGGNLNVNSSGNYTPEFAIQLAQ